jgi:hypothetical protein
MFRKNRTNRRYKEENLPPEKDVVKPKFDDATEKLKYAVVIDSVQQAKRAIEEGADVNALLYNDESVLRNAKSADMAKMLIENGSALIYDKKGEEDWYFVKTINFGSLDIYHELKDSGFLSEVAKNQSFHDKVSHNKDIYRHKSEEQKQVVERQPETNQSPTFNYQDTPMGRQEQKIEQQKPALLSPSKKKKNDFGQTM